MAENATPQRDSDVITYETFAGLRNDVPPERFSPPDLAVGDNINLDKSGYMQRRDGYTLMRAGTTHSLWTDLTGTLCFFVSGGQLYRLNSDYSATLLKTLTADLPVSFWRVNDTVYYSNGVDTGIFEKGAVRSWGLPVPALPGVTVTVGNLPAGVYLYTMTYLRSDMQESGAPLAGTITVPDGSGLAFTMPLPPDPSIAAQLLYLSTPNGEVMYMAESVAPSLASFSYTDSTLALNTPLNTQFYGPAPAGQLITWYRGHMFVAQGDVLYPSLPHAHELFDLRRYIALDGRITLVAPLIDREMYETGKNSGLFIGTDRSCGVLVGSSPEEFQYVPKADYGAVEGALAFVDGALFGDDSLGARQLPMWLSTQGICVGMPELAIRNITRSKYQFPVNGRGAALFMAGPNRFIASNF